jgi:1-acyl-sn-glycerol-3-phosphate acyltransferase
MDTPIDPRFDPSQISAADIEYQRSHRNKRNWFWYYIVGGLILMPLFHLYLGLRVSGNKQWPSGPLLIICNHRSNLDPFAVGVACNHRVLTFMAKVELFRNSLLRFILPRWGVYPLIRQSNDIRGVRVLMEALKRNETVALFPEGTRSRTGEVGPFNSAFVRIAVRQRIPIVLAAIKNTEKALPRGSQFPNPRVGVTITLGEPIELQEHYGKKLSGAEADAIAESLRQRIIALLDEGTAAA